MTFLNMLNPCNSFRSSESSLYLCSAAVQIHVVSDSMDIKSLGLAKKQKQSCVFTESF